MLFVRFCGFASYASLGIFFLYFKTPSSPCWVDFGSLYSFNLGDFARLRLVSALHICQQKAGELAAARIYVYVMLQLRCIIHFRSVLAVIYSSLNGFVCFR